MFTQTVTFSNVYTNSGILKPASIEKAQWVGHLIIFSFVIFIFQTGHPDISYRSVCPGQNT